MEKLLQIRFANMALISRAGLKNCTRMCSTSTSAELTSETEKMPRLPSFSKDKTRKISRAMKAYLEKARANEQFMQEKAEEFELGKRHLANMMGTDAETMTQEDIDKAIQYLLPSGLFEKEARPIMKHPEVLWPKQKSAACDVDGRPFHPFFYTLLPNFYKTMHEISVKTREINLVGRREKLVMLDGYEPMEDEKLNLGGTDWLTRTELSQKMLENTTDAHVIPILDHRFVWEHKKI